jgi:hypothetical protein
MDKIKEITEKIDFELGKYDNNFNKKELNENINKICDIISLTEKIDDVENSLLGISNLQDKLVTNYNHLLKAFIDLIKMYIINSTSVNNEITYYYNDNKKKNENKDKYTNIISYYLNIKKNIIEQKYNNKDPKLIIINMIIFYYNINIILDSINYNFPIQYAIDKKNITVNKYALFDNIDELNNLIEKNDIIDDYKFILNFCKKFICYYYRTEVNKTE